MSTTLTFNNAADTNSDNVLSQSEVGSYITNQGNPSTFNANIDVVTVGASAFYGRITMLSATIGND